MAGGGRGARALERIREISRSFSREGEYQNAVAVEMRHFGSGQHDAERAVLNERLRLARDARRASGGVERKLPPTADFEAGLETLFNSRELQHCKGVAETPTYRRLVLPATRKNEVELARGYFTRKYKGAEIHDAIAMDYAERGKLFDALTERLRTELIALPGGVDVRAHVATTPEMQADIGKVLRLKAEMSDVEKRVRAEFRDELAGEAFKKEFPQALERTFAGPAMDLLEAAKAVYKGDVLKFLGKSTGAAIKFSVEFTRLSYLLAKRAAIKVAAKL